MDCFVGEIDIRSDIATSKINEIKIVKLKVVTWKSD